MVDKLNTFMTDIVPQIRLTVEGDGHYLNVVNFPLTNELQVGLSDWLSLI